MVVPWKNASGLSILPLRAVASWQQKQHAPRFQTSKDEILIPVDPMFLHVDRYEAAGKCEVNTISTESVVKGTECVKGVEEQERHTQRRNTT